MSKLVTIYGGSGFVGRYVARRMAKLGWRVRVAVRRPNEALFVKPYGVPGQVEPVLCNVRDDNSVRAAMLGADAVVNCVGTFSRRGKNGYQALHVEAPARIGRIARELGIARLVHVSAIGADAEGRSDYARTKGEGEKALLAAYPDAMILRPSVIFGTEDSFFNKLGSLAVLSPVLPVPHASTRLQPVFVDDVAAAAVKGATGEAAPGIYELGGPEVASFGELARKTLSVIQRRRVALPLAGALMWPVALVLDLVEAVTGGLVRNSVMSRDQLAALAEDNVVAEGAAGLEALGIAPVALDAVLPEYLWRFRPSGQYAAIKASAKNLKKV